MSHLSFYRKYRSKTFTDLEGQDHIKETLKNAIKHDRLSQAYIFSGPRGTGKTSSARILARTLNCKNVNDLEPCDTCHLCKSISAGTSVDVIEIDAASHTGVDNIRVLNEQVQFAPVECVYKIYIIDEAHMLSTGAFNALLKTLEEPPENTLFILATTEPQKIPITIHSRCQHLNFRLLSTEQIVSRLRYISEKESIEISNECLKMIARNSSGCMRDAISLLDQIYSFKGNKIEVHDIITILGATNFDDVLGLVSDVLSSNIEKVMSTLIKLLDSGVNTMQLTGDLSKLVKDIIFVKMNLEKEVDLDESRITVIKQGVAKNDLKKLTYCLEQLAKLESDQRTFPNPELLVQIRLLTLAESPEATTVQAVAPQQTQAPKQHIQYQQTQSTHAKSAPKPPAPTTQIQKPSFQDRFQSSSSTQSVQNSVPTSTSKVVNSDIVKNESVTENITQKWDAILEKVKTEKQALHAILRNSKVMNITDAELQIKLGQDFKFFREKLNEDSSQEAILPYLEASYGKKLRLKAVSNQSAPVQAAQISQSVATNSAPAKPQMQVPAPRNEDTVESQKINQIISIFEGDLI